MRKEIHTKSGLGIVEILVSIAIILLVLAGPYATHTFLVSITHANTQKVKANFLAEEGIEAVKTIRDRDWSMVSTLTLDQPHELVFDEVNSEWDVQPVGVTTGDFARSFVLEAVERDEDDNIIVDGAAGSPDAGTLKLTVTVSSVAPGLDIEKTLTTYISNIL